MNKLKNWLNNYKYIGLIAVCAAGFFILFQYANPGRFPDPDGFYHARVGLELWQGRLTDRLPSLYYTILRDGYADQHYLYHALLGIILNLIPYPDGLQASVIIFGTAAVVAWALLLKSWKVRYYGLWILVLLGTSTDFIFRINVPKANTLSLVALAAFIAALHKKRFWLLLPLSFLFVWLYGGFVFIPAIVGAFIIAWFWYEKKLVFKPIIYSGTGLLAGIFLHPQASHLPKYLYYQIFQTGLAAGFHVPVGNEWNPYSFEVFSGSNPLIGIITIGAIILFVSQWKKIREVYDQPATALAISLLHILFLLLAIRSRRFVEYWVPFSVLFCALTFSPYLKKINRTKLSEALLQFWQFRVICVMITSIGLLAGVFAVSSAASYFNDGTPANLYRGAGEYLAVNSQSGQIIFNDKWDQYPQLFYWHPQGRYIIGLDPMFMYAYDAKLYRLWNRVSAMRAGDFDSINSLHYVLTHQFKADYLFVEKERSKDLVQFIDQNYNYGLFDLVYEDDKTALYRLTHP